MSGEKENAVLFLDYMCSQDCAFSKCVKDIGTFSAVLFYLREFELWLKKSPQNTIEGVALQPATSPLCNGQGPAAQ